jgi:hypothetical protein
MHKYETPKVLYLFKTVYINKQIAQTAVLEFLLLEERLQSLELAIGILVANLRTRARRMKHQSPRSSVSNVLATAINNSNNNNIIIIILELDPVSLLSSSITSTSLSFYSS